MKSTRRMGRRGFVKATAGMAAAPFAKELAAGTAPVIVSPSRQDNRIVEGNRSPGTVEWQLQYTSFDDPITLASYPLNRRLRSSAIEGYGSKNSVLHCLRITDLPYVAGLLYPSELVFVGELSETYR